jgi:transformation/transcription domain-associated protein
VRKEYVPLDVLSRYARSLHPDFTAMWLFRRQFTSQLAMTALATYVLGLNKCTPHALKIVATTGNIVPWELAFSLDSSGLLVPSDRVPFRLTPTLVNLATPVGVSGVFLGSFVAGAMALADPEMALGDHVAIILRDEILSWSSGANQPRAVEGSGLPAKIKQNLDNIGRRLAGIAGTEPGNSGVEQLIKNSTATGNLCLMSPMWHPWL